MDTYKSREKALMDALSSGKMDVEEMENVLDLYRDLYPVISKKFAAVGKHRKLSPEEARVRIEEGFTLLDPKDLMPAKRGILKRAGEVAAVLAKHSEEDSPWSDGSLDRLLEPAALTELVSLYLSGGEEALKKQLADISVENDLGLFLVFNVTKGIFLTAARAVCDVDTESWEAGSCPVCGGAPAVASLEGEGGKRYLVCHRCQWKWRYSRVHCPFCGNSDHEGLGYFTVEEESENVRVDFCRKCDGYIKTWDMRDGAEVVPEVQDLFTVRYDLAGEGEGFTRKSPNIFGVRVGTD